MAASRPVRPRSHEPRGLPCRRLRHLPGAVGIDARMAFRAHAPACVALPDRGVRVRRRARPLDVPRRPAPVAARVRPRAAAGALPGEGPYLQRLPAQTRVHGLRPGARGRPPARSLAALGGGTVPPRHRRHARGPCVVRPADRRRAQPCARRGRPAAGPHRDHAAGRALAGSRSARPPGKLPRGEAVSRAPHASHRRHVQMILVLGVAAIAVVALAVSSIRILREYERAVVFRLGRLLPVKGPGLVALIPWVDRMVRVDLRTVTLTIPPQEVITRDNVPARVAAVCYFRAVDPVAAITQIEAFEPATSQIAQTTLRSVLGRADLDQLLAERERLNEDLQQIIDEQTEPWGIKVTTVEIKDVGIPSTMQRAMARQAEAERERRAKVIHAEGEHQAAAKLSQAAGVLSGTPAAIQLRYLQTLSEIGDEQNSTIIFPLPIDLIRPLLSAAERVAPAAESA